MSGEIPRLNKRVGEHVNALREAGFDTQAFFDALVGIRDDHRLTELQRDALFRLIATESFLWYLEAIRGKPLDRIELAEKALEIMEKNEAAIKRNEPGESAAELLLHAVSDDAKAPAIRRTIPSDAPTKLDRPPKTDDEFRTEPTVKQRPPRKPPSGGDAPTRLDRPPKKK